MKSPSVRDLKPNEIATAIFLVHSKEIRQKRTGEPYLSLLLADRSGEMDAKMWDNVAEVMDSFDRDDFIKVKGLLQLYNNRPQFTIHKLRPVQDREVDFGDFFPASTRDTDEMFSELRAVVDSLTNEHIRALLNAFLDDPEIAAKYKIAPAAKTIHHAFRSGLLEHVISLCGLAKMTAGHYRTVDLNLLIAGAVLHDIGKIHELSYERAFGYSPEGQLLGHIPIAIRMLADKLRLLPDFPVELRNLVEHMVLSHHGQLEYGSPKVPIFPEALLFHYLDDLDSKMDCMRGLIEKEPQAEGFFTGYSTSLERVALRKSRYLDIKTACEAKATATRDDIAEPVTEIENAPAPALAEYNGENAGPDPVFAGSAHNLARPLENAAAVAGPAPASKPKSPPVGASLFGAKLQQALNDERK
jgi:3'-5' exoribonuclease